MDSGRLSGLSFGDGGGFGRTDFTGTIFEAEDFDADFGELDFTTLDGGCNLEAFWLTISANVFPPRVNAGRATRGSVLPGIRSSFLSCATAARNCLSSSLEGGFLAENLGNFFGVAILTCT